MPEKNNYGELFCQAIDTIVQERLNEVSFDKTIICTIVNDEDKINGRYIVSNGSASFEAYSTNNSLNKNDSVYVQIPNGDWNEQKLILSRKTNNSIEPITYKNPFNSFINITNNIISKNFSSQGLVANNPDKEKILLWSYNKNDSEALYKDHGEELGGYTRLGLSAGFQAWLKDFGTIIGDYGLELIIETIPEDMDGIQKENLEIKMEPKICRFSCKDMIGNPYNFESFYVQRKLYDISNIKKIKSIELYFYQTAGSFLDGLGELIPYKNLPPNLFVKDITISFGYDTNQFENDVLLLYTLDASQYIATEDPPENNHKKLQIRWIHKFDNGNIKVVSLEDNLNYELTWYRKNIGARSDNSYSGSGWTPLSRQVVNNGEVSYPILDNDWIEYNKFAGQANTDGITRLPEYNQSWLIPDITRAVEEVKAILLCDGQQFYSDILVFSNREEVVSKPTVDAIQALTINCEDNSYGNYLIYNLGGELLDKANSSIERVFKAYFNSAMDDIADDISAQLTEAESIEWIIPTLNTMIQIEESYYGGSDENYIDENGYLHIFRYGDTFNNIVNQNSQSYKIKSIYSSENSNNTIKCKIIKDKVTYTTTKELTFGPAGTAGTDYTFVLDFVSADNVLTLKSDFADGEIIPEVIIQAKLYDYEGKEVLNLNDKNIVWSWANGTNNLMSIIPVDGYNNKIEIQLLDSVSSLPTNNFSILKATLKDFEDYELETCISIPIRSSRIYQFISGATIISYDSLGQLNDFYQKPYRIYLNEGKDYINGEWSIYSNIENDPYCPLITNGKLSPINFYVENSMKALCVVGRINNQNVWSQPIYVYQNKYPSSIVNDWNGKLKIDNANNAILAAKVIAGKKHEDNTFSGIMMGDWTDKNDDLSFNPESEQTGLFGFIKGKSSFGFKDDGTAFIGLPGAGRLDFNGNKSTITSNRMANGLGGMLLDFDDGLIQMINPNNATKSGTIKIDATAVTTPFTIGGNFKVDWDGTLHATNGNFTGRISGGTLSSPDGEILLEGYININDKLWIGDIAGGKYDDSGNWVSSQLVGLKILNADGFAIESNNGKNIRIGNQNESDTILLQGKKLFLINEDIIVNNITFKDNQNDGSITFKGVSINFDGIPASKQTGIYARFA